MAAAFLRRLPLLARSVPLIARVTIALALVAILPLGYAVWSLFDVNRAGMHEQVLRTHAVAASTAAGRVAAIVESRRALARTMAGNAAVSADPRSEVSQTFLQELLAADPSILLVEITTPGGEIVVRAQRRGAAEESDLAAHSAATDRLRMWHVGPTSWLLVGEDLEGGRGTLRLLSDGADLDAALDPVEIGEQAQMILASGSDELISGAVAVNTFPATMVTAARSARVNGTGVFRDERGTDVMGAFAPVDGTSWFVLSRQPADVAQQIARSMRRKAAIAAAVALAFSLLLAFAAQRSIVRPIREVISAQQKLAGSAGGGGNEIDQLRRSAQLVQRRINDQEDLDRVFLGRYQVLGIIGQGGMGTVFRGWDPRLRRQVALKTVRFEEIAPDQAEEMVESLVTEAVSAASMSHPNVVAVYDCEDSPGAAFIAMELVDGVSLQSLLDQRRSIDAERAVCVGAGVARALEAAHARKLLHRDIKPGNVLLGFDGTIKVTDFGLAAMMSTMAAAQQAVFGTPGYIAPEAATGGASDARSDLFALGVVLYQCVTGSNPFDRGDSRQSMIATVAFAPPPLTQARHREGGVLGQLSELVAALMEKSPAKRPHSATVVAERLEAIAREHELLWKLDREEGGLPLLTGQSSAKLVPTISVRRASA